MRLYDFYAWRRVGFPIHAYLGEAGLRHHGVLHAGGCHDRGDVLDLHSDMRQYATSLTRVDVCDDVTLGVRLALQRLTLDAQIVADTVENAEAALGVRSAGAEFTWWRDAFTALPSVREVPEWSLEADNPGNRQLLRDAVARVEKLVDDARKDVAAAWRATVGPADVAGAREDLLVFFNLSSPVSQDLDAGAFAACRRVYVATASLWAIGVLPDDRAPHSWWTRTNNTVPLAPASVQYNPHTWQLMEHLRPRSDPPAAFTAALTATT